MIVIFIRIIHLHLSLYLGRVERTIRKGNSIEWTGKSTRLSLKTNGTKLVSDLFSKFWSCFRLCKHNIVWIKYLYARKYRHGPVMELIQLMFMFSDNKMVIVITVSMLLCCYPCTQRWKRWEIIGHYHRLPLWKYKQNQYRFI